MDLDQEFGTDVTKELEGVWFDMPSGDARMLLAAIDNPKYRDLQIKLMSKNPYRQMVRGRGAGGPIYSDLMDQLQVILLSQTIVLDWQVITDHEGNTVPFSQETVREYLTRLPKLRLWVIDCAGEMEAYQAEDREEAEKNLQAAFPGSLAEASTPNG